MSGDGQLRPTRFSVGDSPEPVRFGPLTRTDIVRYQGASGDLNPIHHDEAFAQASGHPTVIGVGMLSAGLLATFLTEWLGVDSVRRFAVRFKAPVWPGDELTCRGVVTAVEAGVGSSEVTVKVSLESVSQLGLVVVIGSAESVLRDGDARDSEGACASSS